VVQENAGGTLTNLLHGPGTDNLLQRGSNGFVPASLNSTSTMVDGSGAVMKRCHCQQRPPMEETPWAVREIASGPQPVAHGRFRCRERSP
jgi:hypothetical protein